MTDFDPERGFPAWDRVQHIRCGYDRFANQQDPSAFGWPPDHGCVYALIDQTVGSIRYIGQTRNSPIGRAYAHMSSGRGAMKRWAKGLRRLRLQPDIFFACSC